MDERTRHYSEHVITWIVVLVLFGPLNPYPMLGVAVAWVLIPVVVIMWMQSRRHMERLCERCMASMPLDAPKRAQRYKAFLLFPHYLRVWMMITYLVLFIVSTILFSTTIWWLWVITALPLVAFRLSHILHHKYQPWCPKCKGGGEGSPVDAPDPTKLSYK